MIIRSRASQDKISKLGNKRSIPRKFSRCLSNPKRANTIASHSENRVQLKSNIHITDFCLRARDLLGARERNICSKVERRGEARQGESGNGRVRGGCETGTAKPGIPFSTASCPRCELNRSHSLPWDRSRSLNLVFRGLRKPAILFNTSGAPPFLVSLSSIPCDSPFLLPFLAPFLCLPLSLPLSLSLSLSSSLSVSLFLSPYCGVRRLSLLPSRPDVVL